MYQLGQLLRMGPTSERGSSSEQSQYRKELGGLTGSWYLPPEILMMGLPVLVMAMSWMFRD
jgi:hypothetical protein